MRSHATVEVEPGGRVRRMDSRPPLTVRQVLAEPGTAGLCLVGSAAGPLPGDEIRLDVRLAAHATAELTAAGAQIAQGRGGPAAHTTTTVHLGAGARLRADPGALIVCHGAEVRVRVEIELAGDAELDWTETVVLGRSHEAPGRVVLDWRVRRAGRPLLVQTLDLTDTGWSGMVRGRRVLVSRLRVGPGVEARTVVHDELAVTQALAQHASLTTVLAHDTADATRRSAGAAGPPVLEVAGEPA